MSRRAVLRFGKMETAGPFSFTVDVFTADGERLGELERDYYEGDSSVFRWQACEELVKRWPTESGSPPVLASSLVTAKRQAKAAELRRSA